MSKSFPILLTYSIKISSPVITIFCFSFLSALGVAYPFGIGAGSVLTCVISLTSLTSFWATFTVSVVVLYWATTFSSKDFSLTSSLVGASILGDGILLMLSKV